MPKDIELSLDIAMNNLGWVRFIGGVPVACGVIQPEVPAELLALKGRRKLSVREKNVILVESLVAGLRSIIEVARPVLLVGEAPPGGGQNADAAMKLNMALTAVVAVCRMTGVAFDFCTPTDVKKAAGVAGATKEQVMDWTIGHYGGKKIVKEFNISKGARAGSANRRLTYCFLNMNIPGGRFEHIADACAAYEAVKTRKGKNELR